MYGFKRSLILLTIGLLCTSCTTIQYTNMSHEPQLQQFIGEFQMLREQKLCTSSHKNFSNIWMANPKGGLPKDGEELVVVPVGTKVIIMSVQRLFRDGRRSSPPVFYALGTLSIDEKEYEFERYLGSERSDFFIQPWLSEKSHGSIKLDWNNIETIYFTEDVPLAFPSKRFSPQ